jgi:hypothetical protein
MYLNEKKKEEEEEEKVEVKEGLYVKFNSICIFYTSRKQRWEGQIQTPSSKLPVAA